ncbi:MAG: DNA repair protein RecO [Alphaproteobacteria bacterium]|nr:DNA repair protein RecO [Alphaproteobacteria bacterium]MBL6937755.1 DNA repair protein RecO [Alphaproteobacteria bacterium]MBL7099419.1 DNA repair protein RecO [Alphaproteobacteria bacterium]
MEWTDDAIVLSVRAHGENSAILETLTHQHGRHLGLVRGGASRRVKPMLQPGNTLHVHWRARLNEHLGSFTTESLKARAGDMLDSREALAGLNAFAAIASAALPERESHASVFEAGNVLLDAMQDHGIDHWGALYVRWEAGVLDELGFGLDLSRCAATGAIDNLVYVSPRTGRAVSRDGGAAYKERLFALPPFLLGTQNAEPTAADVAAGLKLTGHFLLDRVLIPHGKEMPAARTRLDALAMRESL